MGLAAVYSGNRTISLQQRLSSAPGPGEVLVEPAFVGICGTDLHIFHGHMDARVKVPVVPGHEMSGRVVALGDGVQGWQAGDPVTVIPVSWDGVCPACKDGNTHLCHNLDFLGIDSSGAMQQLWTVPADSLVRLPDDLDLDAAALVEPTAVAVHDVRRARVEPGEKVLVVGGGPVGLLIAVVARHAGGEVVLAEVDEYRRSVAEKLGFPVLDPRSSDVGAAVEAWTEGAGVAVAFEVSGAAAGVTTAVEALAVRGRLCLVAIHPQPREVNLHRFFWRELTLVGARLYDRSDFERAVELMVEGVVPATTLISRVEPLHQAGRAFEVLEAGGTVMKVLVDCRSGVGPRDGLEGVTSRG
jgi:(R,R)-butanediol dehydrogenase/meso-butanediol dehydrogenase/diacetyl reductase